MNTLPIKEIKYISKKAQLESLDPQMASMLDFSEHLSPALQSIHDRDSCFHCKQKRLVSDPNEPTDEQPVRQVLMLFYNLETGLILEKETGRLYEAKKGSARHKILTLLIRHKKFISTALLVTATGISDAGSVSRTIQKMNTLFAKHFETEQKLIVGKIGRGYRINPSIRFVSEK